jgi:hypothetical protein
MAENIFVEQFKFEHSVYAAFRRATDPADSPRYQHEYNMSILPMVSAPDRDRS